MRDQDTHKRCPQLLHASRGRSVKMLVDENSLRDFMANVDPVPNCVQHFFRSSSMCRRCLEDLEMNLLRSVWVRALDEVEYVSCSSSLRFLVIFRRTLSYKEQARLTREACNVLIARIDSEKASCEAMEGKLLQQHSRREQLEATAVQGNVNGCTTTDQKKQVTRGRDIVDVTSCIFLRAADEEDDEEEEKLIMNANQLSESDTNDEGDEIYNFRRDHQQAAARKSLVTHAIKGNYL